MSASPSTIRPVWKLRHPASGLLHLAGAVSSLLGMIWMLTWTSHLLATLVFGCSMVLLYGASSTYHLVHAPAAAMRVLRLLDHSMIYVFIAGSYTPFCLLGVPPSLGIPFAIAMWSMGILGVAVKLFYSGNSRVLRVGLYLIMGWIGAALLPAMYRTLPPGGFAWFVAGGAIYTVGALVYAFKRPDPFPEHFGYHEIWHLFVLGGSGCHFWAISQYVLR